VQGLRGGRLRFAACIGPARGRGAGRDRSAWAAFAAVFGGVFLFMGRIFPLQKIPGGIIYLPSLFSPHD